jgi:hypothetical protein
VAVFRDTAGKLKGGMKELAYFRSGTEGPVGIQRDYTEDWAEYRRLPRRFFYIWLGYVPAMFVVAEVVYFLFHTYVPAFVAAFAWMIWFFVAAAEVAQFSCPRCGECFCKGPGFWSINWWLLAQKCQNCGLKKFAQSDLE